MPAASVGAIRGKLHFRHDTHPQMSRWLASVRGLYQARLPRVQWVSKPATDEATVTGSVLGATAFHMGSAYTESASSTRTDGLPSVPGS